MSFFSQNLLCFFATLFLANSAFSSTLNCSIWESMWANEERQNKVIKEFQLTADEDSATHVLQNYETLSVARYGDWVSISLRRPPTQEEKEIFAALKKEYPLQEVQVAGANGSLKAEQNLDSVEMSSRDYFVRCKY